MKKVLYSGLAILVLGFLTMLAWAQGGGQGKAGSLGAAGASHSQAVSHRHSSSHSAQSAQRSNKGGEVRGLERAEEVQKLNTKADTNRGFTVAPGVEKAEGETSTTGSPKSSTQSKGAAHSKGKGKK